MDDGPLFERLRRASTIGEAPSLDFRVENRREGIYLPAADLYLDPHEPVARAFVSHAHADHAAAVKTSQNAPAGRAAAPALESVGPLRLCSLETAALLRARYGTESAVHPVPWGEWFDLAPGVRGRLHRAGHILGAAALFVETEGGSFLYTGDVRPAPGLTHPTADLPRCDVLLLESTFGLPIFRFPPDVESHASMVRFAREALADGVTPVFLAYALGKGQEVAQLLGSHGVPVRAHGAMSKLNEAYRALGVELPLVRPYAATGKEASAPSALIVPPRERFGAMFEGKRGRKRTVRVAYVSGWALFDASRERFDADLQVPLSDHASFDELERIVSVCAPKRALVTHGYAESFARHLRKKGVEASALDARGYEA